MVDKKEVVKKKVDNVEKDLNKKIDNVLDKKVRKDKEIKKVGANVDVEDEVRRRVASKLLAGTKKQAHKLRKEFRKQSSTAITAAFAFLIALSWREPISESVKLLVDYLGLSGSLIYYKYLTAFFVTIIAVLFLVAISHWMSKEG